MGLKPYYAPLTRFAQAVQRRLAVVSGLQRRAAPSMQSWGLKVWLFRVCGEFRLLLRAKSYLSRFQRDPSA